MKNVLLTAAAALAIGGSAHAAPDAPAPVDFTFALQCGAVEGFGGKRIMLSYQEARAGFALHVRSEADLDWAEKNRIVDVYDGLIAYNHGLPDPGSLNALSGTQVTEVTPNAILVGADKYMGGAKNPTVHGYFDRRTGYGEIYLGDMSRQPDIYTKAPSEALYVSKVWLFQCEPAKPAKF